MMKMNASMTHYHHADARVAQMWHESVGLAGDGPTGIVGPGYSIRAVTHLR